MITVSEYFQYKGVTGALATSALSAQIETLIPYATAIVVKACDRDFLVNTYEQLVIPNNRSQVWLEQYPVNRIIYVGTPLRIYDIDVDDTNDPLRSVEFTAASAIVYSTQYSSGSAVSYDSETTISGLITALSAIDPQITYTEKPGLTYADKSAYIIPCTDSIYVLGEKVAWSQMDDRSLQIAQCWRMPVYIKYNAGYTSIPNDLKTVLFSIIDDLRVEGTETGGDVTSSSVKSESLGDYSYTLSNEGSDSYQVITDVLAKYPVLNNYRKVFI